MSLPKFDLLDSVRQYAGLANRTLAENVRDGSVIQTWPSNAAMILNASSGLASEGGEINEIVKKWLFHGHPMDEASMIHMAKELGDNAWYFALMCFALNMDPAEVLAININKLIERYPDGFATERSLNRDPADI